MKTLLIFPPQWIPLCPHYSIPSLIAQLKAQGYDASDIAFSVANNGTDVAWMPYEQFLDQVAQTAGRTR